MLTKTKEVLIVGKKLIIKPKVAKSIPPKADSKITIAPNKIIIPNELGLFLGYLFIFFIKNFFDQ
jgi:hypothetical protein